MVADVIAGGLVKQFPKTLQNSTVLFIIDIHKNPLSLYFKHHSA